MEIEFYPIKFYKRPQNGWRISLCEIQNFNNAATWHLLVLDYDPHRKCRVFLGLLGADVT